jgi:phosphate butyryltransferase
LLAAHGFDRLYDDAGRRSEPARIAVAGGDDATVLQALKFAATRGWVRPIVVGHGPRIRQIAQSSGVDLGGFVIRHAEKDEVASAAVALVRSGEAQALMKGQIATPELMQAVLERDTGLRTGRVICQVVLMELPRDRRRFLLADTGISVHPNLDERADILKSTLEVARSLWDGPPRVALMAASETVKPLMPETVDAALLAERGRGGEFGDCLIEGPLSFDLAYAPDAGSKKQIAGSVVGAADIMLFPNLLSANLTVKAIMYTAACRFGGVLRGTSAPVVFMSRADTTETRINSLALTVRILDH